jgi:hypothetical protein
MQFSLQREDMKSQPRKKIRAFPAKKIRAFPAKKIRAFPAKKIHAFVVEEKLEIHAFVVENKTKQNKNSALSWSEHTLQTILLFLIFYIFFASYASCDLSQSSRGCDEPRSYSHNAVGLAAADRTQRPVDAAGAEDEEHILGSCSTPNIGHPNIGKGKGFAHFSIIPRPFPRIRLQWQCQQELAHLNIRVRSKGRPGQKCF